MKWEYNLSVKKEDPEIMKQMGIMSPTVSDDLLVVLGAVSQQGNQVF